MSFIDPIKEAKAAAALLGDIEMSGYDLADQQLVFDTIEGQSNFFEVLDAVLERMAEDEAIVEGLSVVISKLDARRARYEHRVTAARTLIEQAMTITELPKIERPTATLSLTARPPSLKVLEEAEIPARYWKPGKPTLDKKALTADLKERAKAVEAGAEENPEPIPGAALSNGAPSLTLRRA